MQQTGPEYRPGHVSHFAPVHSRGKGSADNAAHTGSRHHRRLNPDFTQGFDDTDVREPTNSAATECEAYAFVLK